MEDRAAQRREREKKKKEIQADNAHKAEVKVFKDELLAYYEGVDPEEFFKASFDLYGWEGKVCNPQTTSLQELGELMLELEENLLPETKCIYRERKKMEGMHNSITNLCKCTRCTSSKDTWKKGMKKAVNSKDVQVGPKLLFEAGKAFDHFCCAEGQPVWSERRLAAFSDVDNNAAAPNGAPTGASARLPPNVQEVVNRLNGKTHEVIKLKAEIEKLKEQNQNFRLENDNFKKKEEARMAKK